jgi:hypothetical protein
MRPAKPVHVNGPAVVGSIAGKGDDRPRYGGCLLGCAVHEGYGVVDERYPIGEVFVLGARMLPTIDVFPVSRLAFRQFPSRNTQRP